MEDSPICEPTRIILAIETRLLREMLERAIVRSSFLKIVGQAQDARDLSVMVEEKEADWVFMSLRPDGGLPETAERLLADQPSVSIIGVAADGSRVILGWTEPCDRVIATAPDGNLIRLHWTESHQIALADLSLGELVSVIRKGALWELAIHDAEGILDVERLLSGKRVAILVADGFEQMQLIRSLQALRNTGAKAEIISPVNGQVKGWRNDGWGDAFPVDVPLASADVGSYDGLLVPGGRKASETLSADEDAVRFVRRFCQKGKPIAVMCDGVRLLLEANVVKDRRLTSCDALKKDLEDAGAKWVGRKVVTDNGLVTGQGPDDMPDFNRTMIEAFAQI